MGIKDFAIRMAVNQAIDDYGELKALHVDRKERKIEAVLLLKGEREPLTLHVEHWEIADHEGVPSLRLSAIRCDREWVEKLAARFVAGKWMPLPKGVPVETLRSFLG